MKRARPRAVLQGYTLAWHDEDSRDAAASSTGPRAPIEINLAKCPVSMRLLEILSGHAGARVPKEYIHRRLTGNRYSPHKHDSRLHKLLSRLKKRLEEEQVPELWSLPGDNQVVLHHTIEIG